MDEKKVDTHFISLVMMLASGAWQYMGKVPDQVSGTVTRDLKHAQMFIDLLRMMKDKTKGNLSPDEEKMIAHTVSDLELNYVDEAGKPEPKTETPKVETAVTEPPVAAPK